MSIKEDNKNSSKACYFYHKILNTTLFILLGYNFLKYLLSKNYVKFIVLLEYFGF